jgi:O-antigen/teichoic acid export membrane protein
MMNSTSDELLRDDIPARASTLETPRYRTATEGSSPNNVAINAATNAVVMVVKAIVVLLVSPILIHGLGDTRYGAWIFVSSITAYFALGDLGVKGAIVRFVARYKALHDHEGINRVVNTSLAIFAVVSTIVLAATVLVTTLWGAPAKVHSEMAGEARSFLALSGLAVVILFFVSVPQSLLAGLGQFPLRNCLSIISLLFRHAGFVAVVLCGANLPAVGAVLLANGLIDWGLLSWASRRSFPQLVYTWRCVDFAMVRTLGGYGAHMFASDVAYLVIGQSATLIIGAYLASGEYVTYFSVGATLKDYVTTVLARLVFVLIPAVGSLHAAGHTPAIRHLFTNASRYALYLVAPIETGLLIFGDPFLALWMGRRYADHGFPVLFILSIPLTTSAVAMVAARVLQGMGTVKSLAFVTIVQAIMTVTLGVGLVRPFGIEGVAVGVSLPVTLCAAATIVFACRQVDISAFALLNQVARGPFLATSAATLVWFPARKWLPMDHWYVFLSSGAIGMLTYTAIVLALEQHVRVACRSIARNTGALVLRALPAPAK